MTPPNDDVTANGPRTVIFYGIQGSGKGTQAKLLTDYLLEHDPERHAVLLGMGDLFRTYITSHNTYYARQIKEAVTKGELLPELVAAHVLTSHIANNLDATSHLVLEGVGRTPIQAELLNQLLVWCDRPAYDIVFLDLSKETAIQRLKDRGRYDESSAEQINSRFAAYEQETLPALEVLTKKGHDVLHVNGEESVEAVHAHVLHALGLNNVH